jgi:hypothetical protein
MALSISQPQSRIHKQMQFWNAYIAQILCTAELNMAKSVTLNDGDIFLDNAAWAICSAYHTIFKASPGAAIFGRNILFDIPFVADWNKIGDYRQCQTDLNTAHKNSMQED